MGRSARAVLVMAYGTPRTIEDVEPYYTHIRHGRPPGRELLEDLTDRYRAIGGGSPLLEITERQARGIEERLHGVSAYLGMKHSAPFIEEAVGRMAADGIDRAIGLVLAPHYSKMSIGEYAARVEAAAAEKGWSGFTSVIPNWHTEPGYVDLLERYVHDALDSLPVDAREKAHVIFTAHSLPARILKDDDPYPRQLRETAEAVADLAGLDRWSVAWQSAGRTSEQWLGPDVGEVIADAAAAGAPGVVVCPCGFVADHLEVLYDVDIECAQKAQHAGVAFARTRSPNDDPAFLDTLTLIVATAIER